jgi:hypothetical protein
MTSLRKKLKQEIITLCDRSDQGRFIEFIGKDSGSKIGGSQAQKFGLATRKIPQTNTTAVPMCGFSLLWRKTLSAVFSSCNDPTHYLEMLFSPHIFG